MDNKILMVSVVDSITGEPIVVPGGQASLLGLNDSKRHAIERLLETNNRVILEYDERNNRRTYYYEEI